VLVFRANDEPRATTLTSLFQRDHVLFNFPISAALIFLVASTFAAADPIADPERLRISIIVEEADEWTSLTQAAADVGKGHVLLWEW